LFFPGILSPPINRKKKNQSVDDSPSYYSAKERKLKFEISLVKNLCSSRAETKALATL
jgi:hypothetical protein